MEAKTKWHFYFDNAFDIIYFFYKSGEKSKPSSCENEYGDPRDRDCLVVHYPQGKPSLGQHVQGQPREQPLEQTLVM
jgi:hypothetical protein